MSQEHNDEPYDRGALTLPPEPVARGGFALLIPGHMRWKVSDFAGGYRLDFRPMTPKERARRLREGEER